LENIYAALRELNLEPEVYYIKEHAVEVQSSNHSVVEIEVPEEIAAEVPEFSVFYAEQV
jgi:hypothetical protein